MMKEVEVKARLADPVAVVQALVGMDCRLGNPVRQSDRIYTMGGKPVLKLQLGDPVLRIREQDDGRVILTGKVPEKNMLDKREVETEVTDAAAIDQLLQWSGWRQMLEITKARRVGELGGDEVCVDEVEGLGSFIEIERMVDDAVDSETVQRELGEVLAKLGITKVDRETVGYDILLARRDK